MLFVAPKCVCYIQSQSMQAPEKFTSDEAPPRPVLSLLIVTITFLMAYTARTQTSPSHAKKSAAPKPAPRSPKTSGPRALSAANKQWVETTLRKMTVDEKIGQLLFTTYHGSFTATDAAAYKQMMHDVDDLHVGGFINITQMSPLGIVKSQAYPTAVLTNQLQARSKLPLLIGADFERGTAMRLDEGTSFPTAMALAAAGNTADAYTMGKITALEARAVGIQWIYAPVSDVNNNPGNPIINTRSFGEDPQRVAEFVSAFVRGVEENGGLATAKHFPGHGDTAADSHIDLPVIRADKNRLEHLELIPFRAAIAAGVGSIMTGHLSIPALEPDPNTPATLSNNVLPDCCARNWAFKASSSPMPWTWAASPCGLLPAKPRCAPFSRAPTRCSCRQFPTPPTKRCWPR